MTDKKKSAEAFSTCLENAHFAEIMQKVMGTQGIGSLCAEIMKKAGQKSSDGCMTHCAEMMQAMMKGCERTKQETTKTKKETNHAGNK